MWWWVKTYKLILHEGLLSVLNIWHDALNAALFKKIFKFISWSFFFLFFSHDAVMLRCWYVKYLSFIKSDWQFFGLFSTHANVPLLGGVFHIYTVEPRLFFTSQCSPRYQNTLKHNNIFAYQLEIMVLIHQSQIETSVWSDHHHHHHESASILWSSWSWTEKKEKSEMFSKNTWMWWSGGHKLLAVHHLPHIQCTSAFF